MPKVPTKIGQEATWYSNGPVQKKFDGRLADEDSDDSVVLDEDSEEDEKEKNKPNDIFDANLMFNNNFFNEFSQFKKNFDDVEQKELDLDKILDEVEINFSLPEKNKKVTEVINIEEENDEHELDEEIVEDEIVEDEIVESETTLSFIDQILEDT